MLRSNKIIVGLGLFQKLVSLEKIMYLWKCLLAHELIVKGPIFGQEC
jgi:hypothetical protein